MLGRNLTFTLAVVVLTAACTTQPRELDTTATDEMTHDGLYPVRNVMMDAVWARRDVDMSGYTKIWLQGAGIQYRPVKGSARSQLSVGSKGSTFPLDETQKARLRKQVNEAFLDEIRKGQNFTVVSEPGPDVLIVRGGLVDVVSYVPPERVGRTDVYLDRVGEATFWLEMVDSQSEAVLIRVADRRAASSPGAPFKATPVTNASEVRRMVRFWAQRLTESLDSLSTNFDMNLSP